MNIITKRSAMTLVGLLLTCHAALAQTGNYFAGFQAGTGNSGSYNAFVGYQSGVTPNSGWNNTFLGSQSGFTNRGSHNTFIGAFAGYDNTTGLGNTFTGYGAGSNNTTASSNSFYGQLAGFQTSSASHNSMFGTASGYANITGANNSFFGSRAGWRNTTSNNSFFGFSAGENTTSGGQNVFMGQTTGFANTTGNSNTFVGAQAGLDNTTGNRNSFFGIRAGENNTTGFDNTFIGREAGRNITTGTGNTAIGNYAQQSSSTLTNSTAIGNKAIVRASNAMVLGSINGENGATVTVKVGIGTATPGYNLHVNGNAAKPGGGSWTVASDKRLKQEVQPYNEGLKEIAQIKPVWFKYNGKAGMPTDKRYVGVIAQDVQKVLPHTVSEFVYETEEGTKEKYLDYDANAVTYALVNAVKELHTLAEQQTAEIKKLHEEIAALKGNRPSPVSEGSVAKLWQNSPNPYSATTKIRYYVPQEVASAQIRVISITGQEVYSRELTEKGESEIEISNTMLSQGSYVYQLIIDGKTIDHKKMILSK